ncbi:unnamed protein product, partial [Anisakis simplex]|uniref:T-cell activation inhibitor, mitochondrial (inferred by orthology to a human protein) n=1 Tax=Anisakis simplex TaxID=6269 RepID=A0A0M3J634_ANISI
QQAAVALRPFYFVVHPDRFANKPDIKSHNEQSLKTFNGYLNDLFPLRRVPDPVKVEFYLAEKNVKNLRKVQISLSGTDARSIVVTALTQCNLPTKNVPTTLSDSVRSGKPRNSFDSSEMDAAEEMMRLFRKKRSKYFRRNDLTAALKKHKDAASEAVRAFEKTSELLKEEIAELRERAGVTEIFWTTDWSKSHMRRCLVSVNRVIDHASASHNIAGSENPIVAALRGYCLRLVNAKTCMLQLNSAFILSIIVVVDVRPFLLSVINN